MSLLMGLIFPTKGSGLIKGYPLGSNEAKAIMGYSPEFPNFYSDMSCLEYLVYMGMLSDLSYDEALKRTKELLEECKNNTKNKLDKETKKWIKEWPSSDDKTLVYLLDDKEEENG